MNNKWSYIPLKKVSLSYQVYIEDVLTDQYDREYEVINELPDVCYNLQNSAESIRGLYKGCFLGKQKIIVSNDMEFYAVHNNINTNIGTGIPVINPTKFLPAFFDIKINQTKLGLYYCDITLKNSDGKMYLPMEKDSKEYFKGATFAVNGVENFSVWLDCAGNQYTLGEFKNLKFYTPPQINQFKIKSCSYNNENELLYPVKNWHCLPNGVRIYFYSDLKTKPLINVLGNWYPFKTSQQHKNAYFLYDYTIQKSQDGIWYDNESGLQGFWNGKLGSFKTINKFNNRTVKAIIDFI